MRPEICDRAWRPDEVEVFARPGVLDPRHPVRGRSARANASRNSCLSVLIAPVLATMVLGGPVAAGWVALIGTTELRELRGQRSLVRHCREPCGHGSSRNRRRDSIHVRRSRGSSQGIRLSAFVASMVGAWAMFASECWLVAGGRGTPNGPIAHGSWRLETPRALRPVMLALAPLAWLMAQVFQIAWRRGGRRLLFGLPLYTTRVAHHPIRRDARDVHPDDWRAGRRR